MSKFLKEACVESLPQAILAFNNKADQLELCADLAVDGLTPNVQLIIDVLKHVTIPVKVMLRHRGGNFIYSSDDVAKMTHQLVELKKLNIAGIVFGALTMDNQVDLVVTSSICALAAPQPVTFHKAIDLVVDFEQAIQQLKSISNLKFILSSGGQKTAEEGIPQLQKMLELALPEIEIIPAGKITSRNIFVLNEKLKAKYYHGKKIV